MFNYNNKCDKCGKSNPDFVVTVNKILEGGSREQNWCLDCIRGNKSTES